MTYDQINAIACACAGIKPTLPSAWAGLAAPKRVYQGETADITFMGFDLVVEIDCDGTIEGIISPDGTECYSLFENYIDDIEKILDKQHDQAKFDSEYDRAADRYEGRMAA